jgi:hypothetical protein
MKVVRGMNAITIFLVVYLGNCLSGIMFLLVTKWLVFGSYPTYTTYTYTLCFMDRAILFIKERSSLRQYLIGVHAIITLYVTIK